MRITHHEIQVLQALRPERQIQQIEDSVNKLFRPVEELQEGMTAVQALENGGAIEPKSWFLRALSFLASEQFRQLIMLVLALISKDLRFTKNEK